MQSAITLTIANGCTARERYSYTRRGHCLVGRAEDCDIRFPTDLWHSSISRHHCLFVIEPPTVQVRDLGSLTGTYVNGRLIGQRRAEQPREDVDLRAFAPCTLAEGDEVRVGPTFIRVGREAALPIPELPPMPFPPVPVP
jgi:pSer/pThr/pTyr-binding forkhead associated (FHA) protein